MLTILYAIHYIHYIHYWLHYILLSSGAGPAYEITFLGDSFFSAFGIFAFAFTCHDSSFIIFASMRNQTVRVIAVG
jgi:amino acid permease